MCGNVTQLLKVGGTLRAAVEYIQVTLNEKGTVRV